MPIQHLTKPTRLSVVRYLVNIPLILVWFMILPAALSQQKGIVEGRLVNRTDPSILARGVDLEVIGLSGGMSIIKSATSDASGKFRIEGLSANEPLMIRANYKGANYYSQLSFNAAGRANVEIEVFESTASMKDIQAENVQMAFQLVGDQLKSLETISFNNKTKPPRTFVSPEGNFRFSKAPGIIELPKINIRSPGSSMPLVQSALESPDGQSYYSLYPLRPGITTFEAQQVLPYANRSYTYTKKFFQDIRSIEIRVIPQDLVLSGPGLSKIQTDSEKNLAVYRSPAVKAGSEVSWTFSGGTPVSEPEPSESAGESNIVATPNSVGQNALIIGPLLLMGFILVLWYAFNHIQTGTTKVVDSRTRQLRDRREQLINHVANLDYRYETHDLGRQELLHLREEGMRQLRRISLLLKK